MTVSDSPPPRRSLRVRLARPSARQAKTDSGSEPESDSQDEYEPPRKRTRSSSVERPSTSTRLFSPSLYTSDSHLRQEYPADDPEMVPIAPHARRATVRADTVHPGDDRFASLRTRAKATHIEEDRTRLQDSSLHKPRKPSEFVSVRERLQRAQVTRQAEMDANLAWAAGLGGKEVVSHTGVGEADVGAASQRSQSSRRSGRSKLEQLRQQASGVGTARGGRGERESRNATASRGARASQAETSDRRREARELRQAELEAKQAWASFHARHAVQEHNAEGGGLSLPPDTAPAETREESQSQANTGEGEPSPGPATTSEGGHSLASWLGLAPKESDVSEPVSCEAAQLVDRDSLFIGYVYPLESARTAEHATVLNHLARRVHPHVPVNLLPPALRGAPPGKRGASHDMYALRVLQLRPGRTGEKGAADYSVVEETEDDGEKWGAQKVLNAMREQGIVDAICIVSRWYGGVMLGPDRFTHIHKVATHALQAFRTQEQIAPIVSQLIELDNQLHSLRCHLAEAKGTPVSRPNVVTAAQYAHVQTLDQAQRLLIARQTAVRAQTRVLAKIQEQAKILEQDGATPSQ